MPLNHTAHMSGGDALTVKPIRVCYLCGCETQRRQIVEPLNVAVCFDLECRTRAAQLPTEHCSVRLADGRICGAPSTHIQTNARLLCAWHTRATLERQYAA